MITDSTLGQPELCADLPSMELKPSSLKPTVLDGAIVVAYALVTLLFLPVVVILAWFKESR